MKKLFIVMCIISLTANTVMASAFGGYDAGALNSQYSRDLRMHEMVTRSKYKNDNAIINKSQEPATVVETASDIKSFKFINNKSFTEKELLKVVDYKLNEPATEENIAELRKKIIRFYQNRGFYSAVAFPNTSNISSGELIFDIQEGGRNSITVE